MSKTTRILELEEDSDDESAMEIIDSYIEASEMYLEALKLQDGEAVSSAYVIGMTAVYFGKAFVAFSMTDNKAAKKLSLQETLNAYSAAITFCENYNIGKQFVFTSTLIVDSLRTEQRRL